MPRIRKQTSNRQSTNDRRKIQRKVKESKKKAKKAAKTNTQWKSKTPKDPGIPNNFPFKDQILAEVSETRRLEAEEKVRRKAERRALRSGIEDMEKEGDTGKEDIEVEDTQLTGLQVGNQAIGGIGAKRLVNVKTLSRPTSHPVNEESDEEDAPVLINRELPNLRTVINESDVVIQVIDARDPLSFRSQHLEKFVNAKQGARLLLLLSKIDLCPREAISAWAAHLAGEYPTFPFRSSSAFLPFAIADQKFKEKGKDKARIDDAWGTDAILDTLRHCAEAKTDDKPLTVSVVGAVNVGKSSFINSLVKKAALAVYTLDVASTAPTTTELPQEVVLKAGKDIRLIDTPGFSWKVQEEAEDRNPYRIRDILLRARGRVDKLKDPIPAVSEIILRSNPEDLMLLYKTPAFSEGDTSTFLAGVARSNHLVKKHGDLDVVGASRIILRDWSTGTFARYTNGPKPSASENLQLAANVQSVINWLQPRKELRKAIGLVRLSPGNVDQRRLDIESSWGPTYSGAGNAGSEENSIELVISGDGEEEEVDDKEDTSTDGESTESLPLSANKRKRVEENMAVMAKRVAFSIPKAVPTQKTLIRKGGSAKPKTLTKTPGSSSGKSRPTAPKVSTPGARDDDAYDFGKFF